MCKFMEERDKDTEYRNSIRIAANLLKLGTVSHEDIAKATGLPVETVHALAEELKVASA